MSWHFFKGRFGRVSCPSPAHRGVRPCDSSSVSSWCCRSCPGSGGLPLARGLPPVPSQTQLGKESFSSRLGWGLEDRCEAQEVQQMSILGRGRRWEAACSGSSRALTASGCLCSAPPARRAGIHLAAGTEGAWETKLTGV